MGEVTKNFIEDKSNEDLVSSWLFDKINWSEKTLDQANETAINKTMIIDTNPSIDRLISV